MQILLAEDDLILRDTLKDQLERQGHPVRAVGDGRVALQALEEKRFDLAILDWKIPEPNGLALAKRLRERQGKGTYVVLMTGHDSLLEARALADSGVNAYLPKPLNSGLLVKHLAMAEGYLRTEGAGQPPETLPPPGAAEPLGALFSALGTPDPGLPVARALDAHAILAVTDAQGRITYANDTFCRISKYSRPELIGQDHRILNSGFHSKAFFQELWDTIRSGQTWRGEIRNRAKDGSFYWVLTTIQPFHDAEGRIAGYLSLRSDITPLKQVQETLMAEDERIEMILESANLGSLRFSSGKPEVEVDRRLRHIFGFSGEQSITLELLLAGIHPEDLPEVRVRLDKAMGEPGPHEAKFRLLLENGEKRWIRSWGRSHRGSDGQMWIDGVALDVTEQVAAFENLRMLRAILPMCAWCKKIRTDEGYWQEVEQYFLVHQDQAFSHGICPECRGSLSKT